MKKRITRVVKTCAVFLMFIVLLYPREASAVVTNAAIQQKQDAINNTENEIKQLQKDVTNMENVLKGLKKDKGNLHSYIVEIDKQMGELQDKIDILNEKILEQQLKVEQARLDLMEAEETERRQYSDMVKRIQFMYENGTELYLEIIFSADSFSDFLTKAEYISSMTDYDKKLLEQYIKTKEMIEVSKLELEAEEALLEQEQEIQSQEMANLQILQDAKKQELENTSNQISATSNQIDDYQAEIDEMEEIVSQLEKEIAEEKKKLLADQLKYDGGSFVWPVAKYSRITDEYGPRINPVTHLAQFHNGIDIGSPYGTAIYAAYDGKVLIAAYSSTMGNYVMIDHGDGIITIYMHASKLYVQKGDIVVAGETIAAVGSTGRSTGNHLHFSVRVNGAYVSPWNYVKEP